MTESWGWSQEFAPWGYPFPFKKAGSFFNAEWREGGFDFLSLGRIARDKPEVCTVWNQRIRDLPRNLDGVSRDFWAFPEREESFVEQFDNGVG